ncbi:actin filament-associated protein 1-like 2 [Eucyclogobius newberryi]|uniref:actin filament-associated protein 1-like 2 n=1 Tax=Eucyclogobius newberryi TaxID=166745 RepID=UPI003B593CB6
MKSENMEKQKVLAHLLWDLQSFLSLLDSENLSFIAQAQKKSLSELLTTLHSTATTTTAAVEDAEYMVMSCPSSSPSEATTDLPVPDVNWSLDSNTDPNLQLKHGSVHSVLTLPPDEEDTYEEAAPYVSQSTCNSTEKAESDSSHYESYGDEDDDDVFEGGVRLMTDRRFVQWSASQPCLRPTPESRLCGYLWRRKWLGQWTKQLFIVRNHSLMCYKCSRDPEPQMELDLRGCFLLYKSKPQRKVPHTLRLVLHGSESLVLGFSSYQHAEEWRKVIEELSSGDIETQSSSVIRTEPLSCRSSAVQTDSDDERSSALQRLLQDRGFLNVLMNCQWQSLRCEVEGRVLNMFAHRDQGLDQDQENQDHGRSPQYTVSLIGCEVLSGPDTPHSYRITLSMLSDTLAVLEVNSSEEKERWINLLKESANQRPETSPPEDSAPLSGLQTWRFPSPNSYETQPLYSNSSVLQHQLHKDSSRDSGTYSNTSLNQRRGGEQRCVQRLELTGKLHSPNGVKLRAESEIDLATKNKRTSFRQSLAICTERAQSSFLTPLLRRTASAKLSLKRAPSVLFLESGRVSHQKKAWETKAAA